MRNFVSALEQALSPKAILGDVLARSFAAMHDQYQTEINKLQSEIASLKQKLDFDQQFREAELRLLERQERLHEARRGPRGVQGERGARGERGLQGPRGPSGRPSAAPARIVGWKNNPQRYETTPVMSDGTTGATLDLRPFHAQYQSETS